jgi:uncharacterized protein YndB with AHSA1/START domain
MPSAEHTVVIERPREEVFDFLVDGTNNDKWRGGIVEISRTSDADGVGASYQQVVRGPGGRRIDADYRITRYDRPSRFDFEVTAGPARPTGVFELAETAPGQTKVRFALDLRPKGAMFVMTPMIGSQLRREVAALDKVKQLLEQ